MSEEIKTSKAGGIDTSISNEEKVGSYLRRIREQHGLELKPLAESIRLSEEMVENIEAGKWDFFPIEAYLRSYIISICEKFSLDRTAVLKKFDSEVHSEYSITQTNVSIVGGDVSPSGNGGGGGSKVAIVVVLIVLVVLFVVSKLLNKDEEKAGAASPVVEQVLPSDSDEDSLEVNVPVDTLGAQNTTPELQPIAQVAAAPLIAAKNTKDSLRFECTTFAPPNDNCAIKLRGFDEKTFYFKNVITRQIMHNDTAQIVVTVPERTKITLNGTVVKNLNREKTLWFYRGELVKK